MRFRSSPGSLAVAVVALGLAAFEALMAYHAPIWQDEAHTYWVICDGLHPIFSKLTQDVHPPLYFCLVGLVTKIFGIEPWALRLVSVIASSATVVAMYWTARGFADRRWSLLWALLVATQPVLVYYGHEARSYALFLLWLTLAFGAVLRAAQPDAARWRWGLVLVLFGLLLNTHNLAVFVFPPLLFAGMCLAGKRWLHVGGMLLVTQALAFVTYLPWFLPAVNADGGIAWIAPFWQGSLKWAGPFSSLLALGVGGDFPRYLGPLGNVVGLPLIGGIVTVGALLATFGFARADRDSKSSGGSSRIGPALWLGLLSLVLLWTFSWIGHPIYLIGRYDVVAFPFVVLLIGLGIQRLGDRLKRPALGAVLLCLCAALNAALSLQLWTKRQVNAPPPMDMIVTYLDKFGTGSGDLVVTRGKIALLVLRYAADRAGKHLVFAPFPFEFGQHPGWYESRIFLRDRARLQSDANAIADQVAAALAAGKRVWLVDDDDPEINHYLISALRRISVPDPRYSNPAIGVLALRVPALSGSP